MSFRLGLILTLALFSISSTPLVVRHVVGVPALVLAFWRMLSASGMLWGYSVVIPASGKLSVQQKTLIAVAGVFLGCHFACFFLAVRHTSIANATFLGCMLPVFTVLISLAQKKGFNKMTYVGLAISLLGAAIIQAGELSLGGENIFGNSLALLGAFFIAVTFTIAGKIRETTDTVVYSRMLFLVAAVTLFLISILSGDSIIDFKVEHIPWILFLGFVPSILGHNMLNYGLKYITPTAIASIPLGEPVLASALGIVLFGEMVPPGAVVGGPIILVGVFLVVKNQSIIDT